MDGTAAAEADRPCIDSPDVTALAAFYARLPGWQVVQGEPRWVRLSPPGRRGWPVLPDRGGAYAPPAWPGEPQVVAT